MPIIIEGPGLNPSNLSVRGEGFPNLARHIKVWDGSKDVPVPDVEAIFAEVDAQIYKELGAVGIEKFNGDGNHGVFDHSLGGKLGRNGEVPTGLIGYGYKWKFERAWYYWRASGAGIPPEFAIPFDKEWGKEVRVNGDCVCRGAEFWGEGFGIDSYHIDTPRGLAAFIQLLKTVYKPHPREK